MRWPEQYRNPSLAMLASCSRRMLQSIMQTTSMTIRHKPSGSTSAVITEVLVERLLVTRPPPTLLAWTIQLPAVAVETIARLTIPFRDMKALQDSGENQPTPLAQSCRLHKRTKGLTMSQRTPTLSVRGTANGKGSSVRSLDGSAGDGLRSTIPSTSRTSTHDLRRALPFSQDVA